MAEDKPVMNTPVALDDFCAVLHLFQIEKALVGGMLQGQYTVHLRTGLDTLGASLIEPISVNLQFALHGQPLILQQPVTLVGKDSLYESGFDRHSLHVWQRK